MGVNSSICSDNCLVISVDGNFDFDFHDAFLSSYKGHDIAGKTVVVDLTRASYVDSSALGMMLLLRERVSGAGGKVSIRGANEEVRRILEIANFSRVFDIS